MIVYQYDRETGEYLHPFQCQPNPARPGEFLIPPDNTTHRRPPEPGQHKAAVINPNKTGWELVPDYRTHDYWLPDGSYHKIETLGEEPPTDALDEPPPPTQEQLEKQKHAEWKVERRAKVAAIVVEIDGMKFDGDEASQSRMARAGALAESPEETIRWILADNTVVMVTAEQLKRAARAAGREQEKLWIPDGADPQG